MSPEELSQLMHRLRTLPRETEWAEFKLNNPDSRKIGENASAISNGAALHHQPMGYILWGLDDATHDLVGTTFRPHSTRVGNEELENWLARLLEPRIDFRIHEGLVDGKHVVLFEVPPAARMPTRYSGREYIRVGSYTKPLSEHPEKERALWKLFNDVPFEEGVAAAAVNSDTVLSLIDYPEYFRLMEQPLPDNRAAILDVLAAERVIVRRGDDRYDVTNVGAVLFARKLSEFRRLARKALRVIIYRGDDRFETLKEELIDRGYAVGFQGAIRYINDQLPQNEKIEQALRRNVRMYPEIAIRELVANALIHQDFLVTGAGPTVEIFSERIEITNPGAPLIEPLRFIDQPPRSRNETLAALMRRMNVCEERGTGVDKVIIAIELHQLPAPDFRAPGDNTAAVLYTPRSFADMARDERIRACYQHACLLYVSGKRMTNASLRKRLGIKESSYSLASRLIRDAVDTGLLKPHNEESRSKRMASYLPFWA